MKKHSPRSTSLFHYYLRDHLGSVRVVFNENDSTEQVNHYYPSGVLMNISTGGDAQPMKYTGKELVREWGMESYDYGARWMLPVTGPMFTQPDPLSEKYYDISPYAYCKGNFMNAVDPDGREIVITGPLAYMAVQQLQNRLGNKVQLSLTVDNFLCYNIVGKGHLNKNARRIIDMIDNCGITVKVTTTDRIMTSTGNLFIGGAFMGNNVELNENGDVIHTTAFQEVNPEVLEKADAYSPKGTFIMHELTEAYEGAKISLDNKVSSPYAFGGNSVYKKAHKKATFQPCVKARYYDKEGNKINSSNGAVRAEWYVKPYELSEHEKIIQTIP